MLWVFVTLKLKGQLYKNHSEGRITLTSLSTNKSEPKTLKKYSPSLQHTGTTSSSCPFYHIIKKNNEFTPENNHIDNNATRGATQKPASPYLAELFLLYWTNVFRHFSIHLQEFPDSVNNHCITASAQICRKQPQQRRWHNSKTMLGWWLQNAATDGSGCSPTWKVKVVNKKNTKKLNCWALNYFRLNVSEFLFGKKAQILWIQAPPDCRPHLKKPGEF